MGRNRKTHHLVVLPESPVSNQQAERPDDVDLTDTLNTEGPPERHETSTAPEFEDTMNVPSDIAQEVWESLKEEFYEQIEQLPLSLHRSFALIGEQDREVQACQAELLPTIRSYIKVRQSLQVDAQCTETDAYEVDSNPFRRKAPPAGSNPLGPGIQHVGPDVSEKVADSERQSTKWSPDNTVLPHAQHTVHKEEDIDVLMKSVPSRLSNSPQQGTAIEFRFSTSQSPSKPSSRDISRPSSVNKPSQSTAMRTQGLRETDATVPKSVPFPPRPKPKTTRELLTRISFLTGEQLRASEEKVGLATAAYDSVDRHVRALDAAIREHQHVSALELGESALHGGEDMPDRNDRAINEGEGEDDEEPQLGMIGPLAETEGRTAPRLRRNRKRERRNQQKHAVNAQPMIGVSSIGTHQDLLVDPHEPRYCYCNQVSYGEMIACDNADCSREWFHLGCAGLAAPPKGKVKWYCRDCEELLASNRRRRLR